MLSTYCRLKFELDAANEALGTASRDLPETEQNILNGAQIRAYSAVRDFVKNEARVANDQLGTGITGREWEKMQPINHVEHSFADTVRKASASTLHVLGIANRRSPNY